MVAAGIGSRPILNSVGIDIPMNPKIADTIVTEAQAPMFWQMLGTAAADFFTDTRQNMAPLYLVVVLVTRLMQNTRNRCTAPVSLLLISLEVSAALVLSELAMGKKASIDISGLRYNRFVAKA